MNKNDKPVRKYYKKRLIILYLVYFFFISVVGVCLGFSIVSLINSFDYVICFILVIFALLVVYTLYYSTVNLIFYTAIYKRYMNYDFKGALSFLKKIRPFFFFKKRIKLLEYQATFSLYLDDIEGFKTNIAQIKKYKPQYLINIAFIRCLFALYEGDYKSAKSLYVFLYNKNKGYNNIISQYQLDVLKVFFAKIETNEDISNDGLVFFEFVPLIVCLKSSLTFQQKVIETDIQIIKQEQKIFLSGANKKERIILYLFFISILIPFLAIFISFIITISILSNNPTAETRLGFFICYLFLFFPLISISYTLYQKRKYPKIIYKKTIVINLISFFFLSILGTTGFYKQYDHNINSSEQLLNKVNLSFPFSYKSAYTKKETTIFSYKDYEESFSAEKAILSFDKKNKIKVLDIIKSSQHFTLRSQLDNFYIDDAKSIEYNNKDYFLLPNDYNIYGVNKISSHNDSYVCVFNQTLNIFNQSFEIKKDKNYEMVIVSYANKEGWMKITSFNLSYQNDRQ